MHCQMLCCERPTKWRHSWGRKVACRKPFPDPCFEEVQVSEELFSRTFSAQMYPDFPFLDRSWLAVAFERNAYDNTRMPSEFFSRVAGEFNVSRSRRLLIGGDCFELDGRPAVQGVEFDWIAYEQFMLSPDGFSLEYKMVSDDGELAIWADPELTVVGGVANKMGRVVSQFGGVASNVRGMYEQFFLDTHAGNEDLRKYLRDLVVR